MITSFDVFSNEMHDVPTLPFEHTFSKPLFSVELNTEKIKELSEKILQVALLAFAAIGCVLHQTNITLLINRAFSVFLGYQGLIPLTLMLSTYVALKCILFLSQNSDQKIFSTDRVFNWVKNIPANFVSGIKQYPIQLLLSISIATVANVIFKSFSIKEKDFDLGGMVRNLSLFDLAVKGPFLEELFFRELVQGSLASAMELTNVVTVYLGQGETFSNKTISTTSRVFSATVFGLAHANQSLVQATSAGIVAYYFETSLYEKHGLFGSFGIHFANNFATGCIIRALLYFK